MHTPPQLAQAWPAPQGLSRDSQGLRNVTSQLLKELLDEAAWEQGHTLMRNVRWASSCLPCAAAELC